MLYKLSEQEADPMKREKYLTDAYETLNNALLLKEDDANVHKWMAIVISAMNKQQKATEAIKNLEREKMHLMVVLHLKLTHIAIYFFAAIVGVESV